MDNDRSTKKLVDNKPEKKGLKPQIKMAARWRKGYRSSEYHEMGDRGPEIDRNWLIS